MGIFTNTNLYPAALAESKRASIRWFVLPCMEEYVFYGQVKIGKDQLEDLLKRFEHIKTNHDIATSIIEITSAPYIDFYVFLFSLKSGVKVDERTVQKIVEGAVR